MQNVFIRKGHGYENPSPGSGYAPCTAFAGFTIIREPLPTRELRVLGRKPDGRGGVDYGSHSIKLAVAGGSNDLYLLMENGCGREVMALKTMYDGGVAREALLALPDVALYGVLYMMWDQASTAARIAAADKQSEWANAFAENRIRKSRVKEGRRRIFIEPAQPQPATA